MGRAEKRQQIEAACQRSGVDRLKPIKDSLPEAITYDEIRLVVAHFRASTCGRNEHHPPPTAETSRKLRKTTTWRRHPLGAGFAGCLGGVSPSACNQRRPCPSQDTAKSRAIAIVVTIPGPDYREFRNAMSWDLLRRREPLESSLVSRASPSWRRIASVRDVERPSCIRRSRVRMPHSGTVRSLYRGIGGTVLLDAIAGANVMEQEVAEGVNDLVPKASGMVKVPPLITVPAGAVVIEVT